MDLKLYKRLIRNLIPYKGKVALIMVTSIIVGGLSTSPVPLVKEALDKIFVEKDTFMLNIIPLVLVVLYAIKGGLRYFQSYLVFSIGWELIAKFRMDIFKHIHKLPYGFFEKDTTGKLMSRAVNDVNAGSLWFSQFTDDVSRLTHCTCDDVVHGAMGITFCQRRLAIGNQSFTIKHG